MRWRERDRREEKREGEREIKYITIIKSFTLTSKN